ncbi:MAG: hypothetical protein KatS3mg100_300 [Candidatus Parcubacteria bacterium]|nr:MAG: hypothetical protein KatS3mg100_300 [Candidatus Parcubacteria bacterium]
MVSPELIAYIRDGLKDGFPITDIVEVLQQVGWSNEDIRSAILLLQKEGMIVAVPASLAGGPPQPHTPASAAASTPQTGGETSPTPMPSSLPTNAQPAYTTPASPPAHTVQYNPPTTSISSVAPSFPQTASTQPTPSAVREPTHQQTENPTMESPLQPAAPTPQTANPLPSPLASKAPSLGASAPLSPPNEPASYLPQTPATPAAPVELPLPATTPPHYSAPVQTPFQPSPASLPQPEASMPAPSPAMAPQIAAPSSQQSGRPFQNSTNSSVSAAQATPRALTMPHTPEEAHALLAQMRHTIQPQAYDASAATSEAIRPPQPATSSPPPLQTPTTALAPMVPGAPVQSSPTLRPSAQPAGATPQQAKRHPFLLRGIFVLLLGIALGIAITLGSVCVVAPEALKMCG